MVGDGSTLQILGSGAIKVWTNIGNALVPNVLLVPGLCRNLLSIKCLAWDCISLLSFDENGYKIKMNDTGRTLLCGTSTTSFYHLSGSPNTSQTTTLSCVRAPPVVWHKRFNT